MKTLKDLGDLKGKRVLVRADFNVPLDGTTITTMVVSRRRCYHRGSAQGRRQVILMAHLGRPKQGVPELSLAPVAARLSELLGVPVVLASDTYGEDAQAKVAAMKDGDVVLLENVRFNPEETSKDEAERAAYAKKLAALGDVVRLRRLWCGSSRTGSDYDVAADCRPPLACWWRRKSTPSPRRPRIRNVRSPLCSVAPRSPISSE